MFPTCVGMNRDYFLLHTILLYVPHVCGDEPSIIKKIKEVGSRNNFRMVDAGKDFGITQSVIGKAEEVIKDFLKEWAPELYKYYAEENMEMLLIGRWEAVLEASNIKALARMVIIMVGFGLLHKKWRSKVISLCGTKDFVKATQKFTKILIENQDEKAYEILVGLISDYEKVAKEEK